MKHGKVSDVAKEDMAGGRAATGAVVIVEATVEDAATILDVQQRAFHDEAVFYDDFSIPPLVQTLTALEDEFADKVILKAVLGGRIVGSVRAWERDGTCHIERLVVHPDFQGHGIGSRLMGAIERHFLHVPRFELFTGHKSERNLRLYQKLGYEVFKHRHINDKLTMAHMQKGTSQLIE